MIILIFFILGLIVGSFLNVVVCRVNLAETIMGRSYCPSCKNQIRWYDNIPLLSFAILKTKCRDCETKISWQYPLVELGTGIVFALTALAVFSPIDIRTWYETIFYAAVFAVFIVVFVYDFKYMEIPTIVLWVGVGIALLFCLLYDGLFFNSEMGILSSRLYSGMLAGIAAFTFFFILSAGSKEKWMGLGDADLAFLIGLSVGWPKVLPALFLAFFIGAIIGSVLILKKKKTMESQVPFGPFMVLGAFLVIIIPKLFPAIDFYLGGLFF